MSTIHNPSNFVPTDYEIVEYLDNRPPEAIDFFTFGALAGVAGAGDAYRAAVEEWRADFRRYYGNRVPHQCDHCGHHIRYVTVAEHTPSGDYVAFGCDCTENRLGLEVDEFKVKYLRDAASRKEAHRRNVAQFQAFMVEHPDFAAEYEWVVETQPNNSFLTDVAAKCRQYYGGLSPRQISAFVCSAVAQRKRDERRAEAEATKGPVATGKVSVIGKIISFKTQESMYGLTEKMLVELENGSRVYGTQPRALYDAEVGNTVQFNATVEASDRDPTFGFFKRPTKAIVV